MSGRFDGYLEEVCNRRSALGWIFGIAVAFLLLSAPYLFLTEPGSAIFVVSTMNAVGFSVFAIGSFATIKYCDRRNR